MPEYFTVAPAYGADYRTATAARAAWEANADFLILSVHPPTRTGSYMNRNDYLKYRNVPDGGGVEIRYARRTKCIMVDEL